MNPNKLTIKESYEALKEKRLSSVDLTKACLARIKEVDPKLNAFITVRDEKEALEEAKKADELIAQGKQNYLTGVPFAVKDAICTKGIRSTGGAKILDNFIPPYDATTIKRIREKGGVIIGKNNCDAFGHGASNENTSYEPAHNPWDLERVPGGSSGGSAAAVAADACVYAVGEDTGGSVRFPAALCGITGLKVSYGRNSRFGAMPMSSSLDTVGPMTKSVWDAAAVMEVIAGHDPKDSTTVKTKVPEYTKLLDKDVKGLRIGLPKEYYELIEDEEIKKVLETAVKKYEELGAKIKEVSLPMTKYALAVYYIIVPSEDSANLARLDGIRYGIRKGAGNLIDTYLKSKSEGFPDEVKRRIMIGTYTLSAGYYDAYYLKAQKVRTLILKELEEVFNEVDILLTPTSPSPAFKIGERIADPLQMYLSDIMVSPASVAGINAISIPCGFVKNLPVGMQLIGPRMKEEVVLQVAHQYQQATKWHLEKPIL